MTIEAITYLTDRNSGIAALHFDYQTGEIKPLSWTAWLSIVGGWKGQHRAKAEGRAVHVDHVRYDPEVTLPRFDRDEVSRRRVWLGRSALALMADGISLDMRAVRHVFEQDAETAWLDWQLIRLAAIYRAAA